MTWIEHWGGPKTMLVIFSSCLLLSSFVMTCQKMLILKLYWCGIDFGAKLFLICHPKIIYVPKISCSEIGALVNKQKWRKKAVNLMNNSTKNKIFRPRSPGQIFCVLKLITRFLNTQRLFLAMHGKNSGYLEITRKILNTRNFFGYFK